MFVFQLNQFFLVVIRETGKKSKNCFYNVKNVPKVLQSSKNTKNSQIDF